MYNIYYSKQYLLSSSTRKKIDPHGEREKSSDPSGIARGNCSSLQLTTFKPQCIIMLYNSVYLVLLATLSSFVHYS